MYWIIIFIAATAVIYHHWVYPQILKMLSHKKAVLDKQAGKLSHRECPNIGVFIAAYNEGEFIEEKLSNLASQMYPNDKIGIHIVTDGCTDKTVECVHQMITKLNEQFIYCTCDELTSNSGKAEALNLLISKYKNDYDVIVFTDVSALLSVNSFSEIAKAMKNEKVAALSGSYIPDAEKHPSLQKYWHYQNAIRQLEGCIGSVNGFAGAMFAIKSDAVTRLASNVINDDFVQVVNAINKSRYACFSDEINIVEREADDLTKDWSRRVRIAAGNWQQLKTIFIAAKTFNTAQRFSFFSNKVLRALMPILMICAYLSLITMAFNGQWVAQSMVLCISAIHLIGLTKYSLNSKVGLGPIDSANYLVASYLIGLYGIVTLHRYKTPWRRVNVRKNSCNSIHLVKRIIDIFGASVGLILTSPIIVLSAIAIKLDSKGSVFYKQLRVGKINDVQAELIYVYKLRSMRQDAEQKSGAVWAKGNDNRVTRVGRFLRKTRIDELPQLWNVLKGEMSLIGPRPERPVFYQKLEREVPYFIHRTYDVKPGISGLAQVMNGYDESIEDVRNKIAWDYSYVLSMSRFSTWITMECAILMKTIKVVIMGKGQ